MGDFEINICPKCTSKNVTTTFDEITQIRSYLYCHTCGYLEVTNSSSTEESEEPKDPTDADTTADWQQDPDFWKQDDSPD
jgi:transcription elongation factor Elf1